MLSLTPHILDVENQRKIKNSVSRKNTPVEMKNKAVLKVVKKKKAAVIKKVVVKKLKNPHFHLRNKIRASCQI